ncbi:MAG: type II toxin-antitoxin system RelE/ParE family toxin [Candidatus Roizmanbacteria bacterium]|nr:type II toxin-antitoxin system RelE/ParE family toxin [Candidatus Roizmanbacteria bacterium]
MKFQIWIDPNVEKSLKKLPKVDYYRVLSALSVISNDPFIGKKLRGELFGSYNYRVWPYRIIYQIKKREMTILITRIGHRQGVYR